MISSLPAEGTHVGRERPDLGGTRLGALDRGHAFLADVHALGHLDLSQPHPLPGLDQRVSTTARHQCARPGLDLGFCARKEPVQPMTTSPQA